MCGRADDLWFWYMVEPWETDGIVRKLDIQPGRAESLFDECRFAVRQPAEVFDRRFADVLQRKLYAKPVRDFQGFGLEAFRAKSLYEPFIFVAVRQVVETDGTVLVNVVTANLLGKCRSAEVVGWGIQYCADCTDQ